MANFSFKFSFLNYLSFSFFSLLQQCRDLVGDRDEDFKETWYRRYRSTNIQTNPVLRHKQHIDDVRTATSLLDAADEPCDGCGSAAEAGEGGAAQSAGGLFGTFTMFEEEE